MRVMQTMNHLGELYLAAQEFEPICGPERFVRKLPRFVADLSGRDLAHGLLDRAERETPRVFLGSFDDASVRGVETVLTRNDFIMTRYQHADRGKFEMFARGEGAEYGSANIGIQLDGDRILIDPREDVTLDGPVALISPDEAYNYGMWVLLVIPYLDYLAQSGFDGRLLCFADNRWQRDFLRFMGVGDRFIRQKRELAYRINGRLKAFRHNTRNLCLNARDREVFARLKRRPDILGASSAHERVFISRRTRSLANPQYRALTNEDELLDAMRGLGFHVVEPEYLGFAEQISLFAQAKVVAGLGGAGMFNAVFCAPDATIVSIESSPVFIDAHANLFATSGADYGIVLGRQDMDHAHPVQKSWSIDVPGTVRAIEAVL